MYSLKHTHPSNWLFNFPIKYVNIAIKTKCKITLVGQMFSPNGRISGDNLPMTYRKQCSPYICSICSRQEGHAAIRLKIMILERWRRPLLSPHENPEGRLGTFWYEEWSSAVWRGNSVDTKLHVEYLDPGTARHHLLVLQLMVLIKLGEIVPEVSGRQYVVCGFPGLCYQYFRC